MKQRCVCVLFFFFSLGEERLIPGNRNKRQKTVHWEDENSWRIVINEGSILYLFEIKKNYLLIFPLDNGGNFDTSSIP